MGRSTFGCPLSQQGWLWVLRVSDGGVREEESTKYLFSPAGVSVLTSTLTEGGSKFLISHREIVLLPL